MAVTMAVSAEAVRGRHSFGDDLDADREAPDRGPAQDVIAVMAGLLRDTRSSTFLGGSVLSALTIGTGQKHITITDLPRLRQIADLRM
jgi:hypothetical protein